MTRKNSDIYKIPIEGDLVGFEIEHSKSQLKEYKRIWKVGVYNTKGKYMGYIVEEYDTSSFRKNISINELEPEYPGLSIIHLEPDLWVCFKCKDFFTLDYICPKCKFLDDLKDQKDIYNLLDIEKHKHNLNLDILREKIPIDIVDKPLLCSHLFSSQTPGYREYIYR